MRHLQLRINPQSPHSDAIFLNRLLFVMRTWNSIAARSVFLKGCPIEEQHRCTMDRRFCFLALLIVTLPSCSIFGSDEPALRLRTDHVSYDLNTADVITVTAENQSSSVIYYNTCMQTGLQELDGSRVVASMGFPLCECICLAELRPGEEWSHSVSVAWIKQNMDRFELREENTFRLRLAFYRDKRMKVLLDENVLYSNRFVLEKWRR